MEQLSSELITKIQNNPLKTQLRNDGEKIKVQHLVHMTRQPIYPYLPLEFDGKVVWKGYLSEIRNQGKCGSCWAWASVSSLEDRLALRTTNLVHPRLSPLRPLLCDLDGKSWDIQHPEIVSYDLSIAKIISKNVGKIGCHGNTLIEAWRWLYTTGTNDDKCLSYKAVNSKQYDIINYTSDEELPVCSDITGPEGDMCSDYRQERQTGAEDGTPSRFYRALCYYSVPGTLPYGSEKNIMSEIYMNGPVTTGMEIYPSFYTFNPKKEIYEDDIDSPRVGGHAIRIVGWGEEGGKKFWWIANSWGKDWGLNGYFRMIRGVNNCKIEENVVAGLPDLFYPSTMIFPQSIQTLIENIPKKTRTERMMMDFGYDTYGGGIDPRTGFARRVQYRYTGFDFSSPTSMTYLIKTNNDKFVAGQRRWTGRKEGYAEIYKQKHVDNTILIFLLLFISVSLLSLGFVCYNSTKFAKKSGLRNIKIITSNK